MARHMRYLRASRAAAVKAARRPTASCMPGPFGRGRRRGRGPRRGQPGHGSPDLAELLDFAKAYAAFDDDVKVALDAVADGTYHDLDWEEVENAVMEAEEFVMGNIGASNALSDAYDWAQEESDSSYREMEQNRGRQLGERDAEQTGFLSRKRRR